MWFWIPSVALKIKEETFFNIFARKQKLLNGNSSKVIWFSEWPLGVNIENVSVTSYVCIFISSGWPVHRVLLGHRGRVTCLLYPHDEYPRYDREFLVSGGADFSVKLWDIFTGDLLYTFSTHGGELLRLICTPPECSVRVLLDGLILFWCFSSLICFCLQRDLRYSSFHLFILYLPIHLFIVLPFIFRIASSTVSVL